MMPTWNGRVAVGGAFLAGVLGGLISQVVFVSTPLQADGWQALQANILYLLGPDGKHRIEVGSYSGEGERGLPCIVLYDNQHQIRFLIRLAGNNQAPVLVFKDQQHRDRMVMGLGLNDAGEEPFLATFDANGKKREVFGTY